MTVLRTPVRLLGCALAALLVASPIANGVPLALTVATGSVDDGVSPVVVVDADPDEDAHAYVQHTQTTTLGSDRVEAQSTLASFTPGGATGALKAEAGSSHDGAAARQNAATASVFLGFAAVPVGVPGQTDSGAPQAAIAASQATLTLNASGSLAVERGSATTTARASALLNAYAMPFSTVAAFQAWLANPTGPMPAVLASFGAGSTVLRSPETSYSSNGGWAATVTPTGLDIALTNQAMVWDAALGDSYAVYIELLTEALVESSEIAGTNTSALSDFFSTVDYALSSQDIGFEPIPIAAANGVIPEPGTLALLALGGLGLVRRRRRR